jgi:hypothetical protein
MRAMTHADLKIVSGRCGGAAKFPDFFCIGPQRTGSTWLHASLVRHPEILMHRDKETFFFSTLGEPAAPRYRYCRLEDYLASFNDTFGELFLKNYHALRRCGCFYTPKILGESTASYCLLGSDVLEDLRTLNPDLKIIMLLRDPVERAWSHAKKDLVRDSGKPASERQYLDFFSRPDQLARADYSAIKERWGKILKPGHMLLAPSTRIETDPAGLVTDVLRFLGVARCQPASQRHLSSRQNPTGGAPMPENLRAALEEILGDRLDSYRALRDKTGPLSIV